MAANCVSLDAESGGDQVRRLVMIEFPKHIFAAIAQIVDATGSITKESGKSNRISVTVTLDAPTNLTAK